MTTNGYLDSIIQKAFMPTIRGCTKHHLKLSSILEEARKKHRSVSMCWWGIANAYGSVHHNLIQFSLQHYHTPPQFCATINVLYSGLQAKVVTAEWETPMFPPVADGALCTRNIPYKVNKWKECTLWAWLLWIYYVRGVPSV